MIPRFLFAASVLVSSAYAHSYMFQPKPRQERDYAYSDRNAPTCQAENTDVPAGNVYQRGQKIPIKWWWNNHDGGFIKIALVNSIKPRLDDQDKAALNANANIIQGQCYTRQCDRNGFDPGQTKECVGQELEFPTWLQDGDYTLLWSQIGGYNSEAVATRSLPIYHTCANIRIQGGAPKTERPADWIAPFFGGDMVKVNGEDAGPGRCAFKQFAREPEDPKVVNVKDDDASKIKLGAPEGWAAPGKSVQKRNDFVRLPRVGHISRNVALEDLEDLE